MGYRLFPLTGMMVALIFISLPAEAQPTLPFYTLAPSPALVSSQPDREETLTLDQAVDWALRNHPLVRAAVSGREIVEAQLREAQAGYWPLFQFSEIFTYSNNPQGGIPRAIVANATLGVGTTPDRSTVSPLVVTPSAQNLCVPRDNVHQVW